MGQLPSAPEKDALTGIGERVERYLTDVFRRLGYPHPPRTDSPRRTSHAVESKGTDAATEGDRR